VSHPDVANTVNNVALADVLCRITNELVLLKRGTMDLELAIGRLTGFIDRSKLQSFYQDLQFLDNLGQSLESLAIFVANTADNVPKNWHIDLDLSASKIQMKSIADRISPPNFDGDGPQGDQTTTLFF
jgi:hypothetical protein